MKKIVPIYSRIKKTNEKLKNLKDSHNKLIDVIKNNVYFDGSDRLISRATAAWIYLNNIQKYSKYSSSYDFNLAKSSDESRQKEVFLYDRGRFEDSWGSVPAVRIIELKDLREAFDKNAYTKNFYLDSMWRADVKEHRTNKGYDEWYNDFNTNELLLEVLLIRSKCVYLVDLSNYLDEMKEPLVILTPKTVYAI